MASRYGQSPEDNYSQSPQDFQGQGTSGSRSPESSYNSFDQRLAQPQADEDVAMMVSEMGYGMRNYRNENDYKSMSNEELVDLCEEKDAQVKHLENKTETLDVRIKENMGKAQKREAKLKEVIEGLQKKLEHAEVKSGERGKWDTLIRLQQEARSNKSAFNDLAIKYENLRKRKYDKDAAFKRECDDEKKIQKLQKEINQLRDQKYDLEIKHDLELAKKDEKIDELKLVRKPLKLLGQVLFHQNDDLVDERKRWQALVKASKYTILDQKRRAKLQDQKSKISRMPKISLPKKPRVVKQEPAEELANTHRFSHESNKKIMSTIKKEFIKQEFIKMELSPELQKQKEKIMQMMPKIPLTKGTIIKQDIKTEISPRLQKQLEKIRKHMPKISLPRKRKSDLVNENGNSNQNENDPDDEIPPSKKQKTSRLGGPKSKRR